MKKYNYTITVNHAFEQVIRSCSLPRSYADETWISEDIIQGYCEMFNAGYGYSIEVWQQEELVGGLYGVTIGKGVLVSQCLATKPMFQNGFYTLMLIGQENQLPWIDCQLVNSHLISLGASTLSRQDYLKSLQDVIIHPSINWKSIKNVYFQVKQ